MLAEMSYYRAHHMEGHDEASLADLRMRCAAVLREHLPPAAGRLRVAELTEALLSSIRFRPYPDAAPALGRLRLLGIRSAVVSNWDVSLRGVLGEIGLGGLVDDIVVSAEAGAAKPDAGDLRAGAAKATMSRTQGAVRGRLARDRHRRSAGAGLRAVLVDRAAHGRRIRRGWSASSPSRTSTSCWRRARLSPDATIDRRLSLSRARRRSTPGSLRSGG